jgi:hypothetical protein
MICNQQELDWTVSALFSQIINGLSITVMAVSIDHSLNVDYSNDKMLPFLQFYTSALSL